MGQLGCRMTGRLEPSLDLGPGPANNIHPFIVLLEGQEIVAKPEGNWENGGLAKKVGRSTRVMQGMLYFGKLVALSFRITCVLLPCFV